MPKPTDKTVRAALDEASRRLSEAGVENPEREAQLLLAHTKGVSLTAQLLHFDDQIEMCGEFKQAVERRALREPFAYITAQRGFWDLDIQIGPGALIPRPETELLIDETLRLQPDRHAQLSILDLGTGSGCILVTLLALYERANGIGIDKSRCALYHAVENARANRVTDRIDFIRGDWTNAISGTFNLIVSNPPYIARDDYDRLEPEVRFFEPVEALVAGADGLDAYRAIVPAIPDLLHRNGHFLIEIGQDQEGEISNILEAANLSICNIRPDLSGINRCIIAQKNLS